MLVLTREENETICIGDAIRIVVLRIDGGGVRLGIDAPRDVAVWRPDGGAKKPAVRRVHCRRAKAIERKEVIVIR